jgi:riboflavin kinase, archaea type
LPQLTFLGVVFSGEGKGKQFVDLPWVKQQIEKKLGFSPYLGTLNLHLAKESAEKKKLLNPAKGICVKPEAGYCSGVLFKAFIGTVECAVVVPLVPDYPADVLEVIAPLYLRGKLGLADGEAVEVKVTV